MVGPWAYGGFEGRHVDRWLSSRAGWSADVLRGGTKCENRRLYFFIESISLNLLILGYILIP